MSRVLPVALVVLGAACGGATNFSEIPLEGRIALLGAACVVMAALHVVTSPTMTTMAKKKIITGW